MKTLDYSSYQFLNEAEKVAFFDGGASLKRFKSEKAKRQFLQQVFDKSDNHFLRKKAIESLALMCIFDETSNNNTALSLLLDVENDDEPFVLSAIIKYLFLLNEKLELNDQSIFNKIDTFRFHSDGEVASSAEFYIGMIHLFSANLVNEKDVFFREISLATVHFEAAKEVTENRQDACLLYEICKLIKSSIAQSKDVETEFLATIRCMLEERKRSFIYLEIPDFELWIYRVVSKLHEIVSSRTDEWLDLRSELNNICCFFYNMIDIELNVEGHGAKQKLTESIDNFILKPFYRKSLGQYLAAIKRLRHETSNVQLRNFCTYLTITIEEDNLKKKPDLDVMIQIMNACPDADHEKLKLDVENCDLDNPISLVRLIGSYVNQKDVTAFSSITGSRVGDEIFRTLIQRINFLMPDYPNDKLLEFQVVLSDVIRYMLAASSQKASGGGFFNYLFDKNSSENDLQESMYAYLGMKSSFGARYSKEVSEVADGGRVDILYSSDCITLPVELKKTELKPTNDSIAELYLGQAQTYCYPHDQLGLFVLLDNSNKADELQSPINDIRDLFIIQNMEPYYKLEQKAPNYVVSVIVPGNKITPSVRSKYK
jgi:hypothetical protein